MVGLKHERACTKNGNNPIIKQGMTRGTVGYVSRPTVEVALLGLKYF